MPLAPPALVARRQLPALALLATLAACDGTPATTPGTLGIVQSEGDARAVDPAACAGLDECACSQAPGCMPLTTACWCPPDACGSTAHCLCSGGRFLGCNPRRAGCAGQCGLFADPSERDQRGCIDCVDPTDCATAVARLPSLCPSSPAIDAGWICGGSYGSCASICVAQLETCAGATCALCKDCSCGNDLFDSCLSECLVSVSTRQ